MSEDSSENSSADQTAEQAVDQSSMTTTPSITSISPATSLQSLSLSVSTDDKKEKLKISLDNSTNTYYSGEHIRGTISLCCKQRKKIRGKFCLFELLCIHFTFKKYILEPATL